MEFIAWRTRASLSILMVCGGLGLAMLSACGQPAAGDGGGAGGGSTKLEMDSGAMGGNGAAGKGGAHDAGGDAKHVTAADGGSGRDAGADASDAAPEPGEPGFACDEKADCNDGHCVDGMCCESACNGTCMACARDLTGEDDGQCAPVEEGEDPDDECDADSSICKASACNGDGACGALPDGTVCRAAEGGCDLDETCSAGACPSDAIKATEVVCRASAGPCDTAEGCDGVSKDCPADVILALDVPCRSAAGACDIEDVCDGFSVSCPSDVKIVGGTECRPSAGACDLAEACDGVAVDCPVDGFKGTGTLCRASVGVCDVAEVCSGSSPSCGSDAMVTNGTTCRMAVGPCDQVEACNGVDGQCPVDAVKPAETVCRVVAGTCDAAEECNGSSTTCPSDVFNPSLCTTGNYCSTAGNCVLNPKRVFSTSSIQNGNMGGLAGADQICQGSATNAGLTGTYKAFLSVNGTSASARMTHSAGEYQLVGGTKIADNWTDLTDETLDAPINKNEHGAAVAGNQPWTGTTSTGIDYTNYNCSGWTSSSMSVTGVAGSSNHANTGWATAAFNPCSTLARIICIEQ